LEVSGKKTPLLIGIHGDDVDLVIDQIDQIGKKIQDIFFVITPPPNEKFMKNELQNYFKNIFDSVNIKNPFFIYNNPEEFAGNYTDPNLIKVLMDNSNLYGIFDTFDNINDCKLYIQLISENFSLVCTNESNFQKFFQLIPINLRTYCGIAPNISNLANLGSKLYYCATEEKILELHNLQEQINDHSSKIYDIKTLNGQVQRGLKYAFLTLYKENFLNPVEEFYTVSPNFHRELDEISKERIEAEVNYLLNQKYIYQLYFLGKEEIYQLDDIINRFSSVEILVDQGKIKKIIGPFDADNNTIYRVNFEKNQLIFRFRTSDLLKDEVLVREKLLFPFLDGNINPYSLNFREEVKQILLSKSGAYIFHKQNQPIIPVSNLIYYDETKEIIPYIFTVQNYIHGKTLYNVLTQYLNQNISLNKSKITTLFKNLGETLGKLHNINFNSFQENIYNIGKKSNLTWLELFKKNLDHDIKEAVRNKISNEKEIQNYFNSRENLIEQESEPVLVHNDFQGSNIIIKDTPAHIQINGIIDFDNWGIGVRAQDFVKMGFLLLKPLNTVDLDRHFYEGYSKYHKIDNEFREKIQIYTLAWLIREFNFEVNRNKNLEQNNFTEKKILLYEKYLNEIKRIVIT